MNTAKKRTFSPGQAIDGKYTVVSFVNDDHERVETYRTKNAEGKMSYLRLINTSKLHHTAFDESQNLLEIEILKRLQYPNIATLEDSGELIHDGKKFFYATLAFSPAESLSERLAKHSVRTAYDVRDFANSLLSILEYLHNLPDPVVHNGISAQSIWLDLNNDKKWVPRVFDLSHARFMSQSSHKYNREGLNLHYVASECFHRVFTPQSDLYSVGVLMYEMLFGVLPWQRDISNYEAARERPEDLVLAERERPLIFPNLEKPPIGLDDTLLEIVHKALQKDTDKRFASATDFRRAVEDFEKPPVRPASKPDYMASASSGQPKVSEQEKGFKRVAGMHNLKEQLRREVVGPLKNQSEYEDLGLSMPVGAVLWGPPGCGKTFFAECLAEEVGINFFKASPSDFGSIFVHGGQEKIAKHFEQARKMAPSILFLDELDALVANRQNETNQSIASEVNEFLVQIDKCKEKGVFIIGATNFLEKIDPAILRSGRLGKHFHVPPPDFEARRTMFEQKLKGKRIEFGMDYERLARLTNNFVSSDITQIIEDAAIEAHATSVRVSMDLLENCIRKFKSQPPSNTGGFEYPIFGRPKTWNFA